MKLKLLKYEKAEIQNFGRKSKGNSSTQNIHYHGGKGKKAKKAIYLTEEAEEEVEQKHPMSMPLRGC